jgi:hypothetical protein
MEDLPMSRIAKIVGGRAIEFRIPAEFTPQQGETWIDAPDWAQRNSIVDGNTWLHPDGRAYTAEEMRYAIAPLTLLDRLTATELKVVIALALGATPQNVTDQQEGAWRLMLSLGATGKLFNDGRASLVLPSLFGSTRAAQLLAPDPTGQPS